MSSSPPNVVALRPEDRERALATVLLGFSADPFLRYLWPDPAVYCDARPIIDVLAGAAVTLGTGYQVADFGGAALWLPPQHQLDQEKILSLMQATVPAERLPDLMAISQALDGFHPKDDCWYLSMIAVDPGRQGQGLGSLLMKEALRRCDAQGLPAFLESSNPQNISLYERHGFETLGQIKVSAAAPLITPMLRAPRTG